MPLNPGCEKRPAAPDLTYVPPGGYAYTPKPEDSWWTLGERLKGQGHPDYQGDRTESARKLVAFNFKTTTPSEVNWYLYHKAGCRKTTPDKQNYKFSIPGPGEPPQKIYLPTLETETVIIGEPPQNPLKGMWVGIGAKVGGADNLMPPPVAIPEPGQPYLPPRSPITVFPLPDYRGNDQILVSMWSLDRTRRGETFQMKIDVKRTGFNWGGGGGAVVVIVTGLDGEPKKIQGLTSEGWDFNAALGEGWSAIGKAGRKAPAIGRLASVLGTTLRKGQSLSPEAWEKVWENAKAVNGLVGTDYTAGSPQLTIIDVPGLGGGVEASVYVSTTTVTSVFGNVRAFGG
jgi:hypothetical protein